MNWPLETRNHNIESHCSAYGIFNVTETEAIPWMWNNHDKILITVVFPILATVGVLGNFTFVLTTFRRRELHNSLSVFLVNLAICDILYLACFVYWVVSLYLHSPIRYNQKSEFNCVADSFLTYTWYIASVGFVTVISFERYLAICKPLKHRLLKGTCRNVKINICIWAVALILSCAIVFYYVKPVQYCIQILTQFSENRIIPILQCEPYNEIATIIYIFLSVIDFFVPLCLNVILYSLIIYTLSNRLPNEGLAGANNVRNRVARVLVANGIVFFMCHLPFRVGTTKDIILGNYQSNLATTLSYDYAFILLNSAINPYLYVIGCKHYRQAVYMTITCKNKLTLRTHSGTETDDITAKY